MSSSTGHTSTPRSALTSVLLPCLNSPTTSTWNAASSIRCACLVEPLGEVVPPVGRDRLARERERGEGRVDGLAALGSFLGRLGVGGHR